MKFLGFISFLDHVAKMLPTPSWVLPPPGGSRRGTSVVVAAVLTSLLFLVVFLHAAGMKSNMNEYEVRSIISSAINDVVSTHRKLLSPKSVDKPDRFWGETNRCTVSNLAVLTVSSPPLPSGIPSYEVTISNVCSYGCDISKIHVHCGWFSSAFPVDPMLFKRVRYNDCIVNAGQALRSGESFSFKYANTYSYPLAVSTLICSG